MPVRDGRGRAGTCLIEGRPDYRILVSAETLVYAFAVVGQLVDNGSVEILSIDVDFGS